MKKEVKERGIAHGMVSRIAKMAGVSPSSVSNVLNGRPNVSNAIRLKVATAAKKVLRLTERERTKSQDALAALNA